MAKKTAKLASVLRILETPSKGAKELEDARDARPRTVVPARKTRGSDDDLYAAEAAAHNAKAFRQDDVTPKTGKAWIPDELSKAGILSTPDECLAHILGRAAELRAIARQLAGVLSDQTQLTLLSSAGMLDSLAAIVKAT